MNASVREVLRRAIDAKRREIALGETASEARKNGDPTCSRCYRPVADHELSPGRPWCRYCENRRRREAYRRAKARKVAT